MGSFTKGSENQCSTLRKCRSKILLRIIVTGGAGFIGSHLANRLSQGGHQVTVVDAKPSSAEGTRSINLDLLDRQETVRNVKDCDCVAHLAAILGVDRTETDPLTTLDGNITVTKNVLEACRANSIEKLVLASSSEVYGDPRILPIGEASVPQPISVYGVSKLACEQYVKAYNRAHALKYCILRYFNAYGPGQSEDFIIPRFVSRALKNETITIFGDGLQVRCFAYVSDIVDGTRLAIESGNALNETINLGNDAQPITVIDLARRITELTSSRSQVQRVPLEGTLRADREIRRRIPDISKAKKILGYDPRVSLDEGIRHVVSWISRTRNRGN
jgi:UDP-glucose 4-epimerase